MSTINYRSPDVIIEELDSSTYATSSSTTTGAIVLESKWGPVLEATLINSVAQLKNTFGEPDETNYMDWFVARNYLSYSNSLQVVRVIETETKVKYTDSTGKEVESVYMNPALATDSNPSGIDGTFQAYYRLDDPEKKQTWGMNTTNMINNYSRFESKNKDGLPHLMARYPGKLGSNIYVGMINKKGIDFIEKNGDTYTDSPIYKLTKSHGWNISSQKTGFDEIACAVWTSDPSKSDPIEFSYYSLDEDGVSITGYPNYIFTSVNKNSSYIYLNPTAFNSYDKENNLFYDILNKVDATDEYSGMVFFDVQLYGGQDKTIKQDPKLKSTWETTKGTTYDENGIEHECEIYSSRAKVLEDGWDLFANEETDDNYVNLLMQGSGNVEVGTYMVNYIAEKRLDCIACLSPMYWEVLVDDDNKLIESADTIVTNMIDGSGSTYPMSSYAFMDGNFKYQWDVYNSTYRWVPLNGDTAGLFAYIDETENPWYSIGNRNIDNCTKLAFYPSKDQRDKMFDAFINPVTNFRNSGNVVYGDWTRKANSAFNFVGVRRTFLYLERTIKDYSREIMFKQNDTVTSASFTQVVKPFLENVQDNRGIEEFNFKCGSEITSAEEIEQGIFKARIMIKPVRSIRYIVLQFNAVRSDVSLEEVE